MRALADDGTTVGVWLGDGDAFQLAAARAASDDHPEALPFVTLDDRLPLAASREGFPVLGLA